MFLPLPLGIIRFSAPPLVCSAPGAELNSARGAEKKQGGQKFFSRPSCASLPPLKKISAPAKINPAHATVNIEYEIESDWNLF